MAIAINNFKVMDLNLGTLQSLLKALQVTWTITVGGQSFPYLLFFVQESIFKKREKESYEKKKKKEKKQQVGRLTF
jgi:hypothetical protein